MKNLLLLVLLCIPGFGYSAIPGDLNSGKNAHPGFRASLERSEAKTGFRHQFIAKTLQKKLNKASKAFGKRYGHEGKWLSILGLSCGLLGAGALGLITSLEFVALIISIVLGVGGLILSLISLDQATDYEGPKRWIKPVAVAGIILNLLLVAFAAGLTVIALAFGA